VDELTQGNFFVSKDNGEKCVSVLSCRRNFD